MGRFEGVKDGFKSVGNAISNAVSSNNAELWSGSGGTSPGRNVGSRRILGKEDESFKRIDYDNLEKLFYMEPLINSAIMFYVTQIVGDGYHLEEKGSKQAVDKTKEALSMIGFDEVAPQIIQQVMTYGNSFAYIEEEKPYNVKTINPKLVEFIKDRQGNPITDPFGEPVGIVSKSDNKVRADEIKDIIEEHINELLIDFNITRDKAKIKSIEYNKP
mgnify:CR=1 FL=1